MTAPLLPADEFLAFGSRIEKQSLRALKRFQEYGRWAETDAGLEGVLELAAKILLDAQIYELEERTLAFEMLACEALACRSDLPESPASGLVVVLGGRGDKLSLYRQLLQSHRDKQQEAACLQVFTDHYRRHWEWIEERHQHRLGTQGEGPWLGLLQRFCELLNEIDPLQPVSADGAEANRWRKQAEEQHAELETLKHDLEFAEDRAERAHRRIKKQESEMQDLRRQVREERENGEKLRQERSRRIKLDRSASENQREIDSLKQEYFKLERRLQVMSQRLAASQQQLQQNQGTPEGGAEWQFIRALPPEELLGFEDLSQSQISQARRRFAVLLHPDRMSAMPPWTRQHFAALLGVINEACDRCLAQIQKKEGRRPKQSTSSQKPRK